MRFIVLWLALLVVAGCSSNAPPDQGSSNPPGAGSDVRLGRILQSLPSGNSGPVNFNGSPVSPKVVAGFQGPIPTNDWWTSLIWQFYPTNPYSENLFAHPLALRALADGLGVSTPSQALLLDGNKTYQYPYQEDVRISVVGLNSPDTKVESHSDWTVTARWQGANRLSATIGHGIPFVYCTTDAKTADILCQGSPIVYSNQGSFLGITVGGHHYGLFAPSGSSWVVSGNRLRADVPGGYFSVAALPDNTTQTLAFYKSHAFAFVKDTKVSWSYDPVTSNVTTNFDATVEAKEPGATVPLMALYRHQWLNSSDPLTAYRYASPRGEMRVLEGSHFATRVRFTGVLPNLPDVGNVDKARLFQQVDSVYRALTANNSTAPDTYWAGKDLGRLAALVPLAEQAAHPAARDLFLKVIRARLDDWFDGQAPGYFAYNPQWTTTVGFPASYGSDTFLNDHHFHYGYFIMAAATLGRYQPDWVTAHREDVNELVRDAANPDRNNTRFPFLRSFDPYAGHSWASGAQMFASGNNQESSSEAMNFNSAVVLWGSVSGQNDVRDLGAYLYTTESQAIAQYWQDVDQAVFPAGFEPKVAGIVWGNGATYATFWTANPEEIHGINFLPLQGGSLYLGQHPQALERNYQYLLLKNPGPEQEWKDIIRMAYALTNPIAALARYEADSNFAPEPGESVAHIYHWLKTLTALGLSDPSVGADVPTYAVTLNGSVRTYVAFNPTSQAVTVHFSDGAQLQVTPGALATTQRNITQPPPTPTPTPSPTSGPLYVRATGLSPQAGSTASSDVLPAAGGSNYDGNPHLAHSFLAQGLTGGYSGGSTTFDLSLDAGTAVATGTQIRLSYDFEGDGTWDRVETYNYFPSDNRAGWEHYTQKQGLRSAQGAWRDFKGGSVKLEVWNAIGAQPVQLQVDGPGVIQLPLGNTTTAPPPPPPPPVGASRTVWLTQGGLAAQAGTGARNVTIASAQGRNYDGQPNQAVVYRLTGLTAAYNGQASSFRLFLDAGSQVGCGTQVRLSYDFDGDGKADRVELFNYFPSNDVVGWEEYNQGAGPGRVSGSWADMRNGSLTVEIWNAIGNGPVSLRTDATDAQGAVSVLKLPF